jgi:Ran GTPase-activating protein (RanGAP) involved in mRNA processing and transport
VDLLKNDIGIDQAKDLVSIFKEHPTLKSLCGNKGDETELDMSGKMSGAGDATMLAGEVVDNGALLSVDVGNNGIPADKLQEIDQAVRSNRLRLVREDSNKSLSEIDLSSRYLDAKDAIVVAEYIKDNGALTNLDMSNNNFYGTEAGKALGKMLAVNTVLKQLDLSGCNMRVESTKAFAVGIRDNGALSSLNLSTNSLTGKWGDDMPGNTLNYLYDVIIPDHHLLSRLQVLPPLPTPSVATGHCPRLS